MSGIRSSVDVADSIVVFAGKLFKGLASSLGNEEGGEAAEQHEESVDLQDVVQPVLTIVSLEGGDGTLADDGTNLARGGRDTVRGGTVSGGEDFTRDNESGGVGT
jgi:hypothetical protein